MAWSVHDAPAVAGVAVVVEPSAARAVAAADADAVARRRLTLLQPGDVRRLHARWGEVELTLHQRGALWDLTRTGLDRPLTYGGLPYEAPRALLERLCALEARWDPSAAPEGEPEDDALTLTLVSGGRPLVLHVGSAQEGRHLVRTSELGLAAWVDAPAVKSVLDTLRTFDAR